MKNIVCREQVAGTDLKPIIFKQGLPGFNHCRNFTLQAFADNPFFYYLQSLDDQGIGLILLDPFFCFPGYSVELSAVDMRELKVDRKEDLLLLTTVTFLEEKRMTTNLAAPIIINMKKRLARQIIIPAKMGEMKAPLHFKNQITTKSSKVLK